MILITINFVSGYENRAKVSSGVAIVGRKALRLTAAARSNNASGPVYSG